MDPFNDIVENEVLLALIEAGVDFIVVGGAAVQHYGLDRPRKDLDILLNPSEKNAAAVARALPGRGITPEMQVRLARPKAQMPLAGAYCHIEFLTSIDGVSNEDAERDKVLVVACMLGKSIAVLSKAHLIASKKLRRKGRDLTDIAFLETT